MRSLRDKKRLYKLLAYFIMFDGGVYYTSGAKHCNFVMNHTSRQFIEWAAEVVGEVTGVRITERKDYNRDGCSRQPQWRLESKAHPVFTKFRERLYFNGYKSVDSHWLKALDAEALALLYMAEGSFKVYGKGYWDINLNTKRLTEGDNKLIINYLRRNLGIEASINRQGRYTYIRIASKSQKRFFSLVEPYMLSEFAYKLPDSACDVPLSQPA